MAILNISPVSRAGMRFMISLYGMSETGKTLSALKLAAGMEPDPRKRGLLDSEGGQRGRAYVDAIDGGYLYGWLTPPFTPERYVEAIAEFEAAGVTVLVIDSISHAWNAEGGVLDMVENATEKNDMAKWKGPKRRLGKMTRRILSSDMHIILCSRGKEPMVEQEGPNGKRIYVKGPVLPVQEKSLRFDMTIMAQMLGDGRFTVTAPAGKCPGSLRSVFANQELMNEEMGRKLIAWLGQQGGKTAAQRAIEVEADEVASEGTEAFRKWWTGLDMDQRAALKPHTGNYASIAKAADAEREEKAREAQESQTIDDPFPDTTGARPMKIEDATTGAKPATDPTDDWALALADLKAGAAKCDTPAKWQAFVEAHEMEVEQLRGSKRPELIADWDGTVLATVKRFGAKQAAE